MSVTVESELTTNSTDFDPIFPDRSSFFSGNLVVVQRLSRIASNGPKCYSELARDQTRNLRFAMCSQSSEVV